MGRGLGGMEEQHSREETLVERRPFLQQAARVHEKLLDDSLTDLNKAGTDQSSLLSLYFPSRVARLFQRFRICDMRPSKFRTLSQRILDSPLKAN